MKKWIYIYGLVLILFSCGKGSNEVVKEIRTVNYFKEIHIHDDITLEFVNGEIDTLVEVETKSKLLDGVELEIIDSVLQIHNKNALSGVADYNTEKIVRIAMTPHKDSLLLHYKSSGGIFCQDTMTYRKLEINLWGGTGDIDLTLNCGNVKIYEDYGTCTTNLKGRAGNLQLHIKSYGLFDCRNLNCGNAFISHYGSNNIYVHPRNWLSVNINSIGNVYYWGEPERIDQNGDGSGQLIPMN
jgi:hypothetical protein